MAFWDKKWIRSDSALLGSQASHGWRNCLIKYGLSHRYRSIVTSMNVTSMNLTASPVLENDRWQERQGAACLPGGS
ncbi:hypothetical protein PGQ11_002676 [Apiospora arundinis]|uniref:Uncharacterized protein n=1 Tax=Apiospora arundinis TaxID=335852 RepID=A0ABR2JIU8_9PEZI